MLRSALLILFFVLTLLRCEIGVAGSLEQRTQSFTILLQGSVAEATPLFGPVREAEWAPGWSPRFLHPAEGAQREGVIFTTITSEGKERLWLLSAYDIKAGRVDYVIVTPGFTANEVKIRVLPEGDQSSLIAIRQSLPKEMRT